MGAADIALACMACGGIVGLATWAGLLASGGAIFLGSLVSSAVVITTSSGERPSHPARVGFSHGIAMLSGIALRGLLPLGPGAVALAVAIALAIVLIFDALHPPALANAGFAYASPASAEQLLGLTAATALVLVLAAIALPRLRIRPDRGR
ncbi:HPP family protein [Rhizorhabdus dicambivorans]|nr:HPP family protein [Rhizorhabdus dicambivorans]